MYRECHDRLAGLSETFVAVRLFSAARHSVAVQSEPRAPQIPLLSPPAQSLGFSASATACRSSFLAPLTPTVGQGIIGGSAKLVTIQRAVKSARQSRRIAIQVFGTMGAEYRLFRAIIIHAAVANPERT